jgi:hypothetical protein
MAGRRLKLTRSNLTQVLYQYLGAYRLRVDVSDPDNTGADPYVFLYLRRPVNPYNNEVLDDFHAVVSPVDLAEYPVGEPDASTTYPFFRTNFIELDFRATSQALQTWVLIVTEINNLLLSLDRMDQLVVTEETYVGAPPPTRGDSASSSISESRSVSRSASHSG